MKVKFITAIYSNLNGSEFGGRVGRGGHYRWSLISLLRMSDADFTCYIHPDEKESLEHFFFEENNINRSQLKLISFDLTETKHYDLIKKFKNTEGIKLSDRCFEIQYNKFFWFENEDLSYDYYFWIDAGLSHCGLLPDKYLSFCDPYRGYYDSDFFDNIFLNKLFEITNDKLIIIGKDNVRNYWSGTVPSEFYKTYDNSIHIIGGMFGGRKEKFIEFVKIFEETLINVVEKTGQLWFEENILSLIYQNYKELFKMYQFDTWWHETNGPGGLSEDYFTINKSFYKALEDIKYG